MEILYSLIEKEDKIVRLGDARDKVGGCVAGWKLWAATNNVEWNGLVKNGILASELLATKDAMAKQLVERMYNLENK